MKVWIDDDPVDRAAPAGWTQVFTAQECIALLARGGVTDFSLDHDLGGDEEYETATTSCSGSPSTRRPMTGTCGRTRVDIHTANFSASPRMAGVINRYSGLRELPGRRWEH